MKKLIVFPAEKSTTNIGRYKELIEGYEIVSFIGPKGWDISGKDISIIDGGINSEVRISEEFQNELDKCDAVLFVESDNESLKRAYKSKIELALSVEKEVIMTKNLADTILLTNREGIKFIDSNPLEFDIEALDTDILYKIETPIICVMGTGRDTNKFDIQLALRKQFLKDGYKVGQIGTKDYSGLFNINKMPDFMYSQNISLRDKVLGFNQYVHMLEQEEQPDVIIIGIPGGIMPLCEECDNYFGDLAYIIGRAIQIDIGILSVYYIDEMNEKYLKELQNYCKYTLQCPVDFFNVSNTMCQINHDEKEVSFNIIESDKIKNSIEKNMHIYKENQITVFNILHTVDINEVYEKIINQFCDGVSQVM